MSERCDREIEDARQAMAGDLTPDERFGAQLGEIDWMAEKWIEEQEAKEVK